MEVTVEGELICQTELKSAETMTEKELAMTAHYFQIVYAALERRLGQPAHEHIKENDIDFEVDGAGGFHDGWPGPSDRS